MFVVLKPEFMTGAIYQVLNLLVQICHTYKSNQIQSRVLVHVTLTDRKSLLLSSQVSSLAAIIYVTTLKV